MHNVLSMGLGIPQAVGAAGLDDSLLPVVRLAILLTISAVAGGAWIGRALTRSWRSTPGEDPRAACRLHDWLPMDDGEFVCLRCGHLAGSSPPSPHDRSA